MNHKRLVLRMVSLILFVLLSTACATSQLPPTSVPSTSTPMPPTTTSVPPTDTPVPPTPTLAEPTVTPIPPTATTRPTSTAAPSVFDPPSKYPSARAYASLAYDSESGQAIMFAGQTGDPFDPKGFSGATWAYDVVTNNWTQMKPPTGPGRGGPFLAYDIESDRVIAFPSYPEGETWDRSDANETWAYDYNTNTWTRLADGPVKHIGARIAYDAESDRIILFGGMNIAGMYYHDTWAYDFNSDTWTKMDPATEPPGRNNQGLTYDSKADRVLTYGGETLEGKALESLWAYDFNTDTWQEMVPGAQPFPGYRDYSTLVYDSESDRSILFGGVTKDQSSGDAWIYEYGTNTWTKLESSLNPGKISRHAMVYIPTTDRSILFGGWVGLYEYTNETWSYDLNTNTWTNMTSQP